MIPWKSEKSPVASTMLRIRNPLGFWEVHVVRTAGGLVPAPLGFWVKRTWMARIGHGVASMLLEQNPFPCKSSVVGIWVLQQVQQQHVHIKLQNPWQNSVLVYCTSSSPHTTKVKCTSLLHIVREHAILPLDHRRFRPAARCDPSHSPAYALLVLIDLAGTTCS